MTFAGPTSFSRFPTASQVDGLDLAVFGVPFDLGTTNRPGARLGPRAIREQSVLVGEFPTGLFPWGYHLAERFQVADLGDIGHSIGSLDRMIEEVTASAGAVIAAGASLLALGGDHLIAYPLLKAHAAKYGKLSLIHLDAHSDTWEDDGHLNHGSMFLRAARDGIIDPATSVQIGMRTPNETHGFNVIDANELAERGVKDVAAACHAITRGKPVYLSADIDFLDPAYAPGTGTPVVGGPTTAQARQLLALLQGIDFVGADLVEVAPPYDHAGITAVAGATLALDQLYLLACAREARQGHARA
jgi:agmatinase